MNYADELEEALTNYHEMLVQYNELVESERYFDIIIRMPFDFLSAVQLCDRLSLFEKLKDKKSHMFFSSKEEAQIFYRSLGKFTQNSGALLDDAAYLVEVGNAASGINDYAHRCSYLGDTYKVVPNVDVISIADRCLREVPHAKKMLTPELRTNFVESCMLSLSQDDLQWLAEQKILRSSDIDRITLTETMNEYQEKAKFLCTLFNRSLPAEANYILKLKGVTFEDKNGVNRQITLQKLKDVVETSPERIIRLEAIPYVYRPEVGEPEPAIRIEWEGQEIGNVAGDVVKEIDSTFKHPQYTATFVNVSGGGANINIGVRINLGVIAPEKTVPVQENQPVIDAPNK